jgi:hypothetical protein
MDVYLVWYDEGYPEDTCLLNIFSKFEDAQKSIDNHKPKYEQKHLHIEIWTVN